MTKQAFPGSDKYKNTFSSLVSVVYNRGNATEKNNKLDTRK